RVLRVTRSATQSSVQRGASAAPLWMWYIEGACPVVTQITAERRGRLRPVATVGRAGALPEVIREMSQQISAGQIAGGLLFVPNAAVAMCFANRCSSIRAVVGTCGEAVEQG